LIVPLFKLNSLMITDIFVSLVKTVLVSSAIAGLFYYLGFPFLPVLGITTILQFVLFAVLNSIKETKLQINLEKETTLREAEYTKQGVDVSCAYCNKTDFVPVRLDQSNQFDCIHCKQTNSLYLNITTAQITDILPVDPLSVNTYIKDKVESIDFEEKE
tara:strand:- start:416 stop:892 length:477 start_codon:yes stop_codon:yes gene_type:complete